MCLLSFMTRVYRFVCISLYYHECNLSRVLFQMESLYEQLGHRRIPGEQNSLYGKKLDLTLLNTEIRPEETAAQVCYFN